MPYILRRTRADVMLIAYGFTFSHLEQELVLGLGVNGVREGYGETAW